MNPLATSANSAPLTIVSVIHQFGTGASTDNTIVITFSEAIVKGSGNIMITSTDDPEVVFLVDIDSPVITISGNTLTFNPSVNHFLLEGFSIEISAGFVKSLNATLLTVYRTHVSRTDYLQHPILIEGTAIDELIYGSTQQDTINGAGGSDIIYGHTGDDILNGGDEDEAALGDRIHGGDGNDTLHGNGGKDGLIGGGGNDKLYGDAGADWLLGSFGDDYLDGGSGKDILQDGDGNNTLAGGEGDDYLQAYSTDDTTYNVLDGGAGNDSFKASGSVNIKGGDGDDTIMISGSSATTRASTLDGGNGNDLFHISVRQSLQAIVATGGSGSDMYFIDSFFSSYSGSFSITDFAPGTGGDQINLNFFVEDGPTINPFGENGSLRLRQDGQDTLLKQLDSGQELTVARLKNVLPTQLTAANFVGGVDPLGSLIGFNLIGTENNDRIIGGLMNDSIHGLSGSDTLDGAAGDDVLVGGDELSTNDDDELIGGAGNDLLQGGAGNDFLRGDSGNNTLQGGSGNDTLHGNAGNDHLYGGIGNDLLYIIEGSAEGNEGDDYIQIGIAISSGDINLSGGSGADLFHFSSYNPAASGIVQQLSNSDLYDIDQLFMSDCVITDFSSIEGDRIDLLHIYAFTGGAAPGNPFGAVGYLRAEQVNNDVVISVDLDGAAGNDYSITPILLLENIRLSNLSARDFVGVWNPNGSEEEKTVIGTAGDDRIDGGKLNDKLFGGDGADTIYGSEGSDWIEGGDETTAGTGDVLFGDIGDDSILGGKGNDVLAGGAGNDLLLGGPGFDQAIYAKAFANYQINQTSDGLTVRDKTQTEGIDIVNAVERLSFSDITINLGMKEKATTISASEVKTLIEIYVAFFNRTPDADGLSYWIDQVKSGTSMSAISESFYNIGASPQYAALTGFTANISNADFVHTFYKNVLGRSEGADAGGLAYWMGKLAAGQSSRGSLAQDILNSAHTFKGNATYGYVADLLDNKYLVGKTLAIDWGITNNLDAYGLGVAIAKAITPTDITAALQLVGISASDMSFM